MTENPVPAATPEFSRPVDADRLPSTGETIHEIAAMPPERAALAERFALLALDRLEACVKLSHLAGGFVRLSAEFAADVVQACVVTLEPVGSTVEERFTLLYGGADEAGEVVLSGEAEIVEPLTEGIIDIGEVIAQQLSLALDPYPHKPGAAIEPPSEHGVDSPFAALAKWRQKD